MSEQRKNRIFWLPAVIMTIVGLGLLFTADASHAGTFTTIPWTDDASTGLDPAYSYTHALNINGGPVLVNGIDFAGTTGANPSGGNFSTTGLGSAATDTTINVTGDGAAIAGQFRYNGNPETFTLTGLTPGENYITSFYSVAWDPPGNRKVTFSTGADSSNIDQDMYNNHNGIRVDYDYTADATGSITYTLTPDIPGNTWHAYGFSNRYQEPGVHVNTSGFELPDIDGWSYLNGSAIPGWTISGGGKVGVSDADSPWTGGSGPIPEGSQVAYIQNSGGTATLSQNVTGLTPGETYRISYRYDARAASPLLKASIDGTVLQENIVPNGGTANPYYLGAYEFTATAQTATLMFENTEGTVDTAVLLDDVRIEPIDTPGWTINAWNDDATSGVDSSMTYTHAINLGSDSDATINGVVFKGAGTGGSPSEGADGANYTTIMPSRFANDSNNVTGGGAALANDFHFNVVDGKSGFTLSGLMPGVEYETTVYGVAYDADSVLRSAAFSVNGSDQVGFHLDQNNLDNGIRYTYRGTADANGQIQVEATPFSGNTWHYYGFSNNLVADSPTLDDVIISDTFSGTNGSANGSNITALTPNLVNLPGDTYVETGFNNAYNGTIVDGAVQLGANAGAGISIESDGDYIKPLMMHIEADLQVGTLAGTAGASARGVGLGFYDFLTDPDNSEVGTGFLGLVLAPSGELYFYENQDGGQSYSAGVAFDGGTFDPNAFYNLAYDIDLMTGRILNVSLEGSAADYSSLITAASDQFTTDVALMAGFTGSSSDGGTFGYVDNFMVSAIVPEPTSLMLALMGGIGMFTLYRRRRKNG